MQDEIEKDYLGRVISICIVSGRGGILKYVHMRLDEYTPRCDGYRTGSGHLEDSERYFRNVGMGNDTQEATLKLSTDGFCTRTCSTSTCLDSCQCRLISMRSCKKLKSVTGIKAQQ